MLPFSTPHLHGDISAILHGLSESNPRDEVVVLEEVQVGETGVVAV